MIPDLQSNLPPRIHLILNEGAKEGPDRIAFTDENGGTWTYAELASAVTVLADELHTLGVRPGDRVMIVCENSIAAIALLYAASHLDAWAVLANARQSAREIDLIRDDCSPRRVFYTSAVSVEAREHAVRHGARDLVLPHVGQVMVGALNEACQAEPCFAESERQTAVLIYTTGTTGRPKGVMLSHRNLAFVACRGKRTGTMLASDTSLCLMPIAHSYGLTTMQGLLFAGAHLHIMPRFSEPEIVRKIQDGTVTVFIGVPALYNRLVDYVVHNNARLKPNRLRYVYTGTAPLDLSLRRRVEDLFGVVLQNGYGLTETAPTISRSEYVFGSDETDIGKPLPGIDIRIVGPDCDPVQPGSPGELHVRGPNVMLGYFRQPDLTNAVIDSEGFLNTGDIVRQAPNGVLSIEGRTKELIIRSGFNVYPPEVEAELNAHPKVLNSAVVGYSVEGNEEIIAFVEPAPNSELSVEELSIFLKKRLAGYKRPQHIFLMESLPFTPNGKILKNALKQRALELLKHRSADPS